MSDQLDDILSEKLPKGRKELAFLKSAYSVGVEALVNRSITDKLLIDSGHKFHIGTTDPQMRRIASWLLTNYEERIPSLIPKLWKRNGREDLKLVGLLIANTDGDPWPKFLGLLRKREPVEALLEVAEEIKRSGRNIPGAEILEKWCSKSIIHHQTCMLIASLNPSNQYFELIRTAPKGGELFERIRNRALEP